MNDKQKTKENLAPDISTEKPKRKLYEDVIDDRDGNGITVTDNHSADYSRINSVEKEIDLPIKPETEEIVTAPDEFKKNQDPQVDSEDINLGRSNSSANTTSTSAP